MSFETRLHVYGGWRVRDGSDTVLRGTGRETLEQLRDSINEALKMQEWPLDRLLDECRDRDGLAWAERFELLDRDHRAALSGLEFDIVQRNIREPLRVQGDRTLLDGYKRLYVAQRLELKRIPVRVVPKQ